MRHQPAAHDKASDVSIAKTETLFVEDKAQMYPITPSFH
jgi:hypothetical protein